MALEAGGVGLWGRELEGPVVVVQDVVFVFVAGLNFGIESCCLRGPVHVCPPVGLGSREGDGDWARPTHARERVLECVDFVQQLRVAADVAASCGSRRCVGVRILAAVSAVVWV